MFSLKIRLCFFNLMKKTFSFLLKLEDSEEADDVESEDDDDDSAKANSRNAELPKQVIKFNNLLKNKFLDC
jgi:hypothetical protein